jgi:hypothetical protein
MNKKQQAKRPTDQDIALRQERRRQAIASAALKGIEFTQDQLDDMAMFDRERMTDEECVAYLVNKYRRIK